MAKKFFYVCAGILLLTISYQVGARNAGAQLGPAQEVAVLSGQVEDGGTIPLPRYQDGSEALESECSWTVSVQTQAAGPAWYDFVRCSTTGRNVRVYGCYSNCGPAGDCESYTGCAGPASGVANYFIIAVRNNLPTKTRHTTLGELKARYR